MVFVMASTFDWDSIIKELISEVLRFNFSRVRLVRESGLEVVKRRIDIMLIDFERPIKSLKKGSWLYALWENRKSINGIEIKGINEKISNKILRQVLEYRALLPIISKVKFIDATLFLLVQTIK